MNEDFLKHYKKIVDGNIEYLLGLDSIKEQFIMSEYRDPDGLLRVDTVEGIKINLNSDGLCGIKRIIEFSESDEEIVQRYKAIREKFFLWPAYAMSINQQRGFKNTFDDRIDLLMLDLQTFFGIINECPQKSMPEMVNEIIEKCILYRAYLNLFTFTWLKSFGNYNAFIEKNKYFNYVKKVGKQYTAEQWVDGNKFSQEYFNALIQRIS